MSNLNENLQKAADVCFCDETRIKVMDIINENREDGFDTGMTSAIKANEYVDKLIMPFYEPHKDEMPIDTFKYLMTLPKEMRTFAGYGKLEDNKDCEIKIG